jgi:gamma-glutamylcyclotransferase
MSGSILYFAYGSNMATQRLRARIASARRVCIASLSGHRLAFHKVSDSDRSGKCDASHTGDPSDRVLGVVYSLAHGAFTALDRFEGRGVGYERRCLTVHSTLGEALEAEVYLATRIDPSLRPFDWYKEHVLRGAVAAALPAPYIASIDAVAAQLDPDPQRRRRELAIYDPKELAKPIPPSR